MNKVTLILLASALSGCLIPVEVGTTDGGTGGGMAGTGGGGMAGGTGGGMAGGAGGGMAGGAGGGMAGGAGGGTAGGTGGGTAGGTGGGTAGGTGGGSAGGGGGAGGGFASDAGSCANAGAGFCNDDPNMSAVAGMCVIDTCVCNPGWELNPDTGKCRLYYMRFPISMARPETYALAMDPAQSRAGLAWIVSSGADGGYDVYYQDWLYAAPAGSPAQKVTTVGRVAGIALAFRGANPVVSFLGGGNDGSAFWHNTDAVIFERGGTGAWTSQTVAALSSQAPCNNASSDFGFLVGLWPALATDGNKIFYAWRDAHSGVFPQQDWASSDLEVGEATNGLGPLNWTLQCAKAGGNDKLAHGQSNKLVVVGGEPAAIYSHGFAGISDATGVEFVRRTSAGWQAPVALFTDQTLMYPGVDALGFAHRPGTGYAVVAANANLGRATLLTTSTDGITWLASTPVGDRGSGADVTIDSAGLLHVSMVDCQKTAGAACAQYGLSLWKSTLTAAQGHNFARGPIVDAEGANGPTRVGIFANGKRAVLYQAGVGFELRLAVER